MAEPLALRYLINAGDDWLLHSAPGTFDPCRALHQYKSLSSHDLKATDQTRSGAKLSRGAASNDSSLSPANILRARGLELTDATGVSPSDVLLFPWWRGVSRTGRPLLTASLKSCWSQFDCKTF